MAGAVWRNPHRPITGWAPIACECSPQGVFPELTFHQGSRMLWPNFCAKNCFVEFFFRESRLPNKLQNQDFSNHQQSRSGLKVGRVARNSLFFVHNYNHPRTLMGG